VRRSSEARVKAASWFRSWGLIGDRCRRWGPELRAQLSARVCDHDFSEVVCVADRDFDANESEEESWWLVFYTTPTSRRCCSSQLRLSDSSRSELKIRSLIAQLAVRRGTWSRPSRSSAGLLPYQSSLGAGRGSVAILTALLRQLKGSLRKQQVGRRFVEPSMRLMSELGDFDETSFKSRFERATGGKPGSAASAPSPSTRRGSFVQHGP
jgi:hypothetical protein